MSINKILPRPLVPVALAFIIGIILADANLIPVRLVLIGLVGAVILWAGLYFARRLGWLRLGLIWLLCLLAGALRMEGANRLPPDDIANFRAESVAVKLTGVVTDEPVLTNEPSETTNDADRDELPNPRGEEIHGWFVIRAERLSAKGETNPVSGLVRVSFYNFIPKAQYGDRVEITGLIYTPHSPTSPGQFDYARYLRHQGIRKIILLTKPEDLNGVDAHCGYRLWESFQNIRNKLGEHITQDFPADKDGFLRALFLGERTALPDDIENNFLRSGTIYFLVVSGLHIAIVLLLFIWLLNLVGLHGRGRSIILIVVTVLYMALTGFNTPVVRAGIMVLVYLSGELFQRKANALNSLALAALIILLIKPTELFSAGFQLSFIAVLSMIMFVPETMRLFWRSDNALLAILPQTFWGKILRIIKLYVLSNLVVSLAAWLSIVIIICQTFHMITPVVILGSLILGLLIFPLLALGIIYLLLSLIGLPLILPAIISPLVAATNGIVAFLAKIPQAYFYLPDIPLLIVLFYYAVFCLWYLKPYLHLGGKYLLGLSGGAILIVIAWCTISLIPIQLTKPGGITLTMIDVHQGASFLVEFPDGKNMLWDAGTMGDFDIGKGTIAPLLWSKGITKIDTLIMSHPHADHINGVPALLERFRIGEIVISRDWFENDQGGLGTMLLEIIRKHGAGDRFRRVRRGESLALANGVTARVLGPPDWDEVESGNRAFKVNDTAIVLQMKYQGKTLLLTADIQSTGIQWLLESGETLQTEVMQLPHHGYADRMNIPLLEVMQPRYVLLNANGQNVSEELLQFCREKGITVLSTYEDGTVSLEFGPTGYIVHPTKH